MTRVGFYFARLFRQEAVFAALSVSQMELLEELRGKTVAIVGNARALSDGSFGAEIDAHDIVIRINRAPMPTATSHGAKTDWLAMATRVSEADRRRIDAKRLMWFSHKRKRLGWRTAQSVGFYLHPLRDCERLKAGLGRQPTTGAMIIDLVAQSEAAKIDLYGFDFFSSLSLSGRRTAEQVPHDFNAEAEYVHGLLAEDARITLHAMR